MDPIFGGALIIVAMLVVAALGVPVALSMAGVGFVGMCLLAGTPFALGTFMTLPYSIASQYAFVVVPMFVLMGAFAATSGLTGELYTAAHRLFSGIRGSLYYTTVLASAGFGAVSGSTVVAGAVFTKVALPEMIRFGYKRSLSAGCIAAAGTFAALIPPSISMVIYGILTGESIGALLMAGVVPGLLTVGAYMLGVKLFMRMRPDWAPTVEKRYSVGDIVSSFRGLWAVCLLLIIVLGGIYSGLMPPSAAGTAGALGALAICIGRRKLGRAEFADALSQTVSTTASLFLIIIGGLLFSRLLLHMGFIGAITDFVESAKLSPLVFIGFVVLIYLVLGCFVDTVTMMVMTIPFIYPSLEPLGLDPIWFAVLIVKLVEISAITPPVGLNLFAVIGAANGKVSSGEVYSGVTPFILIELVVLSVLVAFPQLSLWLPQLMIN
ncbi:TRAP transporter large permease [Ramlibacter sp.]|uniref:TRAP transporter large permease n=1 Tax=Ramlibacter sp. TaxID=1917967 RepID=UPI002FCBC171